MPNPKQLAAIHCTQCANQVLSLEYDLHISPECALRPPSPQEASNFFSLLFVLNQKDSHPQGTDLSLLLAQALAVQSSSSPTHKAPATAKETGSAATAEALERSHLTIVGTVETALRDHEERLNSAMILNSVFVALLTPVIAYAVSKCL